MKRKIVRSRSPRVITIRDEYANIMPRYMRSATIRRVFASDIPRRYFPNATSKYEKSRSFCRVTYTRVVAFSLKKARLWRQTSHRKLSLAVDVCASACVHTYGYIIHGNKIWFYIRIGTRARARILPRRALVYLRASPRVTRYIRDIGRMTGLSRKKWTKFIVRPRAKGK